MKWKNLVASFWTLMFIPPDLSLLYNAPVRSPPPPPSPHSLSWSVCEQTGSLRMGSSLHNRECRYRSLISTFLYHVWACSKSKVQFVWSVWPLRTMFRHSTPSLLWHTSERLSLAQYTSCTSNERKNYIYRNFCLLGAPEYKLHLLNLRTKINLSIYIYKPPLSISGRSPGLT